MVAAGAVASLKALDPSGPDDPCAVGGGPGDLSDEAAMAALDDALTFLSAGLAALRPAQ